MDMINRSAVIVRPKQPYLDWMKQDDQTGVAESTFQLMHEEPTVYLLPEYEDDETQNELLQSFWMILFDAMLEGWLRDPEAWPADRNYAMFRDWFDVEVMSVVEDLCVDEPLELLD